MANYVHVAVVLDTKEEFDAAWEIAKNSDKVETMSAQITGAYVVDFEIRYEMDWGVIRQISKAINYEEIKVFTYADVDGTMELATYADGKRISKVELSEEDVDYWLGLTWIFGNIDWRYPLGDKQELVVRSSFGYPPLAEVYESEYNTDTFEETLTRKTNFVGISRLPQVVKKYAHPQA